VRRCCLPLVCLLFGCPTTEEPPVVEPQPGSLDEGPEVVCAEPTDGFERLTNVAGERGIDLEYAGAPSPGSCALIPGGVAAVDLDGDGHTDLLFQRPDGFPHLYWNMGDGMFAVAPEGDTITQFGRHALGFSAVDLDEDGLPEVIVVGASFAAVAHNEGGRNFGDFEVLWSDDSFPRLCINSMGWGDADGDGDLDLALPTLDEVPFDGAPPIEPKEPVGHPDILLILEDGVVEHELSLQPAAGAGVAVLAAFTDREGDGDTELFIASDRGFIPSLGPSALYMREAVDDSGRPLLTDRAPDLGLDLRVDGMGIDARDINGDGALDYCVTDVEFHLTCVTSEGGGYVHSGQAMGLLPTSDDHPLWPGDGLNWIWSTWGLEWFDVENDGIADIAVAGGPPPPDTCGEKILCQWQPDGLFQGVDVDAFENRSLEGGFADPEPHFGLVSADLSGDGYREIIVGPHSGRPLLMDNPCGSGAWIEVSLRGPPKNPAAIGARVTVTSANGVETQQVWSIRAMGQGPASLHFGLGSADVAEVSILWPDGTTLDGSVGVRRTVTATHPGAL
jgi:enediyne biosynthesis protein E4